MEIFQIAILAVVAAVLSLAIKRDVPPFSILLTLTASLVILLAVLPNFSVVLSLLNEIEAGIDSSIPFMDAILRIMGIAYISEFAAQTVTDAGESAMASKVELAGKVMILVTASPIVLALVRQVGQLVGG